MSRNHRRGRIVENLWAYLLSKQHVISIFLLFWWIGVLDSVPEKLAFSSN